MSAILTEVRLWLTAYRASEGLTYEDLASRMRSFGYPVSLRTIHRLIAGYNVQSTSLGKCDDFRRHVERARSRAMSKRAKHDTAHVE